MNSKSYLYFGSVMMSCLGACASARAGYAVFSQPTDTISITGNTVLGTQATYEAVVRPAAGTPAGIIWNEWQDSAEDKQLSLNGSGIGAYADLGNPTSLAGGTATPGVWHDLAYVYDGSQERVYIDGNLVASRAASGDIPDAASSTMVLGANFRKQQFPSFLGDIDSLRISNTAAYNGASYTPTFGDFSTDPSTLLLYNFDNAPGTTVITDESGNGHTGTLGVGNFSGATSPFFVPEPSSLALLGLGGMALLRRRRRMSGTAI